MLTAPAHREYRSREYVATCEAAKKAVYQRLSLMSIGRGIVLATRLLGDNMEMIKLTEGPGTHSRTRQIDVKYPYSIRERKVEDGTVESKI